MNKTTKDIINSAIAGALVFFGAFTVGGFSWEALGIAGATAMVAALTKFRDLFAEDGAIKSLFNFI